MQEIFLVGADGGSGSVQGAGLQPLLPLSLLIDYWDYSEAAKPLFFYLPPGLVQPGPQQQSHFADCLQIIIVP